MPLSVSAECSFLKVGSLDLIGTKASIVLLTVCYEMLQFLRFLVAPNPPYEKFLTWTTLLLEIDCFEAARIGLVTSVVLTCFAG